jgi:DGQHR domain-containing protein
LARFSFADVLNEDTNRGYQRRLDRKHSLDFLRYIQEPNSTTIPLTLNLRPDTQECRLIKTSGLHARLTIAATAGKILAQVDCQHRLGFLQDSTLPLPFMCFLGLTEREEMEIFRIINGKAKGLNTSLLDYHDAQLAQDLATDRPELFIALYLNSNSESPWHKQLRLGGTSTSGYHRRASLRTMQKAIRRFLTRTKIVEQRGIEVSTQVVRDFWNAVALVLEEPWKQPRKHFLTKGIGVYGLMEIATDLYSEQQTGKACDTRYFTGKLAEFITNVDWGTKGPFRGLGGRTGATAVSTQLRKLRSKSKLRLVAHGK